ncbi:hypothetical protein PDIDSM_5100 [Penicillium digitatum]|nr:hypothetical protein PDIDSM_5100 [Penicillium digitatum]
MASGQTLGFIGCGYMGGAVLQGLLNSAFSTKSAETTPKPILHFIACTKTAKSAARLQTTIAPEHKELIKILQALHGRSRILSEEGVRNALSGKLVISMLAGPSCSILTHLINPDPDAADQPHLMKAIPNMGAQFGQSMTIIETPASTIPDSHGCGSGVDFQTCWRGEVPRF